MNWLGFCDSLPFPYFFYSKSNVIPLLQQICKEKAVAMADIHILWLRWDNRETLILYGFLEDSRKIALKCLRQLNEYSLRYHLTGSDWQRWQRSPLRKFPSENCHIARGQHITHLCTVFPLCFRGHRNWSCRDQSRCLESSMDSLSPQDIRSHCNGNSSPPDDSRQTPPLLCSLCLCICHF